MRDTCYECVIKHLAQAEVLLEEARFDYPLHEYRAWGHLAEASSECLKDNPELANKIRDHRKLLQKDSNYDIPFMLLFSKLETLMSNTEDCLNCGHAIGRHTVAGCVECKNGWCKGFVISSVAAAWKRTDDAKQQAIKESEELDP